MKILFKFIILFLFSNYLVAEILKKVEISGNQRISKQTILVLGDITENDFFDEKNKWF